MLQNLSHVSTLSKPQLEGSIKRENLKNVLIAAKKNYVVAGHKNNFNYLDDSRKLIKKTNEVEKKFFVRQTKHPENEINKIIPEVSFSNKSIGNSVEMENILYGLENPVILDVKIGNRTCCRQILKDQKMPFSYFYKKCVSFFDKILGSQKRGWRIAGGSQCGKHKMINGIFSEQILDDFISKLSKNANLTKSLYTQLIDARDVISKTPYAFVDSSLLIVSDENTVKVKLIDFAYAFNKDDDKSLNKKIFFKYRKRFDDGLNLLIACVEADIEKNDGKKAIGNKDKDNVVGGHKKNIIFSKNKEHLIKRTSEKEVRIYDMIRTKYPQEYKEVFPQSFENNIFGKNSIELENILYDYKKPIVMDLKIGATTMCTHEMERQGYSLFLRTSKKIWSEFKNFIIGSKQRGWRVDGGTGLDGSVFKKAINSRNNLRDFLDKLEKSQLKDLLNQLKKIGAASKQSDFAFVDSSILVAADVCETLDRQNNSHSENNGIKARLIDLAFSFSKDEDKSKNHRNFEKYKNNFENGMNNLILEVENRIREEYAAT